MEETPPLKLLEYQLKLRLAKQVIVFLFIMLLFVWVVFYVLLQVTTQAQFALGRSVGINETIKMFIESSQAVPQGQFH